MKMTNQLWVICFLLLLLGACKHQHSEPTIEELITVQPIRTSDGWGYQILLGDTLFISQPYMPAVEGYIPFARAADAMQVGQLVKERLLKEQLPLINREDLINLKLVTE